MLEVGGDSSFARFPIGITVHGVLRISPRACGHDADIPRAGHFGMAGVAPILTAKSAGIVGDFSNGYGAVAVIPEMARHSIGFFVGSFRGGHERVVVAEAAARCILSGE